MCGSCNNGCNGIHRDWTNIWFKRITFSNISREGSDIPEGKRIITSKRHSFSWQDSYVSKLFPLFSKKPFPVWTDNAYDQNELVHIRRKSLLRAGTDTQIIRVIIHELNIRICFFVLQYSFNVCAFTETKHLKLKLQ